MHYAVTSTSGGRHLEVSNDRQMPFGTMEYGAWSSSGEADVVVDDGTLYNMTPTGFWNMDVAVTKNGLPYANLKYTIRGIIILTFENGQTFFFKKKSFWGVEYILANSEEQELGTVISEFKWSSWGFTYAIDVHTGIGDRDTNLLLPFLMIYCTKYMRIRQSA